MNTDKTLKGFVSHHQPFVIALVAFILIVVVSLFKTVGNEIKDDIKDKVEDIIAKKKAKDADNE